MDPLQIAIEALQKIAKLSFDCGGPRCYYCRVDQEHPTRWEGKLAVATLEKIEAARDSTPETSDE